MSIFEVALESFIDMNHEMVLLSKQIDWETMKSKGRRRTCPMNGEPVHEVLHGREGVPEAPSDESDRHDEVPERIGAQGAEKILKISLMVNAKEIPAKEGKEHKKYESGNKRAIAKTHSGLIVSAIAILGNPYDGHMVSAHQEQTRRLTSYTPKDATNTLMAAAYTI